MSKEQDIKLRERLENKISMPLSGFRKDAIRRFFMLWTPVAVYWNEMQKTVCSQFIGLALCFSLTPSSQCR